MYPAPKKFIDSSLPSRTFGTVSSALRRDFRAAQT
jgi:hypothetical protein